jgi:hypothetical protein
MRIHGATVNVTGALNITGGNAGHVTASATVNALQGYEYQGSTVI